MNEEISISRVEVVQNRVVLHLSQDRGLPENPGVLFEVSEKYASSLVPHPDLMDAVARFRIHLMRAVFREDYMQMDSKSILNNFLREVERLKVKKVEQKGSNEILGISIECSQKTFDGGVNIIKTGKMRLNQTSSYPFWEELEEDWRNLKEEAELFFMGAKHSTEVELTLSSLFD